MGLSTAEFWYLTPARFYTLFGRLVARDKVRRWEMKTFDMWFARLSSLAQESINIHCRSEEKPIPYPAIDGYLLFRHKSVGSTVATAQQPAEYDLEAERAKFKGWVLSCMVRNGKK
jgi:hypothetical protein